MCDTGRKGRFISTNYSAQIDPLHSECGKFIQTLEKHFPNILDEMLNCDNQRFAPTNKRKFTTNFRHSDTSIATISKLLNVPILNMALSRVYIPKATVGGMLKPVEIETVEISETSWTKIENLNKNTMDTLWKYVSAQEITLSSCLYCCSWDFSLNQIIVIDNQ